MYELIHICSERVNLFSKPKLAYKRSIDVLCVSVYVFVVIFVRESNLVSIFALLHKMEVLVSIKYIEIYQNVWNRFTCF